MRSNHVSHHPKSCRAQELYPRRATFSAKEVRLSIRTNPEQKELLRRAALSRNTDLSQFVLEASLASAQQVVAESMLLVLSPADYAEMARALDEAPTPNPALQRLLGRKRVWENEAATDEAATDETATDETATDETATDETATDETATDETATDETGERLKATT